MTDNPTSNKNTTASADEISASANEQTPSYYKGKQIQPFDPSALRPEMRGNRLQGLELVNERFARRFRNSLFDLVRQSADISMMSQQLEKYSDFIKHISEPSNINIITLPPLYGQALVIFPFEFVLLVVDSLFGGDGRFAQNSLTREFTRTEQRIINRLLSNVMQCYEYAWENICEIRPVYQRSETQIKFAKIVNMTSEIIVHITFRLEVGAFGSNFHICLPLMMLEPIRELLDSGPLQGGSPELEKLRLKQLAAEVQASQVELIAEFTQIKTNIDQLAKLKIGDILPIEFPLSLEAKVAQVPVIRCQFGQYNKHKALRVNEIINYPTPSLEKYMRSNIDPVEQIISENLFQHEKNS